MATHSPAFQPGEIRLRDVVEGDLPIFFDHQRDPDACRMAAFPARARDAFMAHWAKIRSDDRVTVRTVLCCGRVAGNIVCWEQEGKRLVGYWIGKEYWGKGVASKALADFLGLVEARPLHAFVANGNAGSIRVLQKCGFAICADALAGSEAPSDGVEELVFVLRANEDGGAR